MTEVAGTVVAIRDGQAIVQCRTESGGCSLCSGGRGCSWRRVVGAQTLAVPRSRDSEILSVGDPVTLAIDDAQLLAAAARLYVPPLFGLLLGPAIVRAVGLEGWQSLVAAGVGLTAGWMLARRWARRTPTVTVRRQWETAA